VATPADGLTQAQIPLDQIVVGDRHRRDLGDVAGLAASMAELGLLQPIVVRPDGLLIAGERRLAAAKALGWDTIPVNVVDLDSIVRGEFAENSCRKDFTLSEAVAIKRALEPIERAAARQRMVAGKPLEKFSKGNGRALDKVAAVVGKHRTTIAKAEAIVDAAEAEPEKFGKLLADMDRSGRVNSSYKRLSVLRQEEAIRREPPPLPQRGPYRVGVADPPWPYEIGRPDPTGRATYDYPQMSLAQICALDVGSIMHEDAILWLWTPSYHLVTGAAAQVLAAWGFEGRTLLTWGKDRMGNGYWLRGQSEHCVLAVRGKPVVTLTNQTTLLHAPMRGHSVKPREFYDLVESLCPAPRYADLFSRYRHNEKWDCHGDEAPAPGVLLSDQWRDEEWVLTHFRAKANRDRNWPIPKGFTIDSGNGPQPYKAPKLPQLPAAERLVCQRAWRRLSPQDRRLLADYVSETGIMWLDAGATP
jgi:ParB/RepB/Spo0J family partition protein